MEHTCDGCGALHTANYPVTWCWSHRENECGECQVANHKDRHADGFPLRLLRDHS